MVILYYIIVYDVAEERVNKINKFLKQYLNWIQNSVFEGELTESEFIKVKKELNGLISKEDSVLIFKINNPYSFEKIKLGIEKNPISNLI
ncbi:MAG: CRISPR-associated endonuclease Cas2 [Candidatus Woesearchaeota archaeon]